MHISVRYTPELRQTVRLNLYLHRTPICAFAIFGTILIVLGVAGELNVIAIAIGALLILEVPILLFLQIYRNRSIFLSETAMTFTGEGIERRTDTITMRLTWDKLKRIHELNDAWVWDMYRPARFVPHVRVLTFRDVNVERLPERDT